MQRMQALGYTTETMQFMLLPLVSELRDPLGSMGNDSALAVLSDKPRMLYDYFKQLFAQVTNPPIDSIREEVIMALECYMSVPEREPARSDRRARPPAAHVRTSDPVRTKSLLHSSSSTIAAGAPKPSTSPLQSNSGRRWPARSARSDLQPRPAKQ